MGGAGLVIAVVLALVADQVEVEALAGAVEDLEDASAVGEVVTPSMTMLKTTMASSTREVNSIETTMQAV